MTKQLQLRRKMSNDGLDPFQNASGAELKFKNLTEKAKIAEQQRLKELRDKERSKKNKGKNSSESDSVSPATTEGESNDESDKDDNEDLPDYKENGYHPVHVG